MAEIPRPFRRLVSDRKLEGKLYDADSRRKISAKPIGDKPVNIKVPENFLPLTCNSRLISSCITACIRTYCPDYQLPAGANAYIAGIAVPSDEEDKVWLPVQFYKVKK